MERDPDIVGDEIGTLGSNEAEEGGKLVAVVEHIGRMDATSFSL